MTHKPFNELMAKMTPAAQKRSRKMAREILAEMELAELREALHVTQDELAHRLKTTQAAVSRLERRGDTKLSTMVSYLKALGGQFEMHAVLPSRTVKLTHAFSSANFSNVRVKAITVRRKKASSKTIISRKALAQVS